MKAINVTITESQRPVLADPCAAGAHAWALAYLTRGGTAYCCRRCGASK